MKTKNDKLKIKSWSTHVTTLCATFSFYLLVFSLLSVFSTVFVIDWYLLTKLYDETGEKDKVCKTAAIVQTKEAKVQSTAVNEMREETKKICERWNISF